MHPYHHYHNYDVDPKIKIKGQDDAVQVGYNSIRQHLVDAMAKGEKRFCLDLYPNVAIAPILQMLSGIEELQVFETASAKKPAELLAREHEKYITDDRVFGKMTYQTLDCCFEDEKAQALRAAIDGCAGAAVVVGVGAGLFMAEADEYFFFDVTRWEIQLRYRRGEGTWMLENGKAPQLTKYKVGFFIEWRLADKHKKAVFDRVNYWVDANLPEEPHWLNAAAFREALSQTVRQPFHMQAYFDASVWGGQWMKNEFDLDPEAENYGWSFDGVPEENALKFDFGGKTAMFPAMTLVQQQPEALLGEHVYGRFGAEFPIRFDYLDTMEGGNLSLQVHPMTSYIQQQFGMHYTQDESYYILDAEEESCVYLGLKPGVDKAEMYAALKEANAGGVPFDAEKFVNKIPVKKHDHVLIPAGTVHCSGKNTTVLEISATPYIFTFKMWDWGRVGLDGIPRPVHLDHAFQNIQFNRDTDWVMGQLIHQEQTLRTEEGGMVEKTGLHNLEFIQTERYNLTGSVTALQQDSVMVVNLVEGREALIESVSGSFDPYTVHYGETIVIPAGAGAVKFTAVPDAGETKIMTAYVR